MVNMRGDIHLINDMQLITGVNDTGDKFTAGVLDTGHQLMTGVNDAGDKTLVSNICGHFQLNSKWL